MAFDTSAINQTIMAVPLSDKLSFVKPKGINYEYFAFMLLALLILLKSPDLFNFVRGAALARRNSIRQSSQRIEQTEV